jgi:putative transposase
MDRTMRVRLKPTPEQASLLAETTRQFTAVFNAVAAYGYEKGEKNGVTLHRALYYPQKAAYPDLVSDHHIQARMKATEAVKSALALAKKGRKVSAPHSVSCPPRFNVHTFKVVWQQGIVILSTTGGRQRVPFSVPAYAAKYVGAKVCTADLIHRDGTWWLHIVVDIPAPDAAQRAPAPTDAVIGVDLGIAQPAVTSNGKFLGKKRWRNTEARYFRLRRALQAKGTKSAKRHLRKMRGKQRRFRRDCDHVLSKQIVASAPLGATIVVENLTNIRARVKTRKGRQARRIHGWSFDQCRSFITYKAEERGCTVAGVDPRHTSQACSCCGHTARNNRRSRSLFVCRLCGYTLHADLNGAINIAAKYRAGSGTSGSGEASVNRLIVGEPLGSAHKPPASAGGR